MAIVSFTGVSRPLTYDEQSHISTVVAELAGPPGIFFSGAAYGVDILAAACAMKTWPDSGHVIVVPYWAPGQGESTQWRPCKHDAHGVQRLKATAKENGCDLKIMGKEFGAIGTESAGYMRRNDILAVNCTHMVAFPETAEEVLRSGTWATIRRARKLGRPVLLCPLNGDGMRRL